MNLESDDTDQYGIDYTTYVDRYRMACDAIDELRDTLGGVLESYEKLMVETETYQTEPESVQKARRILGIERGTTLNTIKPR